MRLSNMSTHTQEIASFQPLNPQFETLAPARFFMNQSIYFQHRTIYASTAFRSSAVFLARVHELWKSSAMFISPVRGMVFVLTF